MLKRIFDFIVSLVLILVLSPLLVVISLLVLIYHGRPVFFYQTRPGKHGKPFKMMKFRSMTNETDENGDLLPNEVRLTAFGKKLRATSLDELPELINVIKGDMSLVGPRPLLMEYVPLFSPRQAKRMEVKPGITGWAQINGRNAISWPKKFELDLWYVENKSFMLDIKILFLTAKKVIIREGISHEGDVSMPRFKGEQ
ncbi:sugar transferase [Pleomorphovibrio marinus]|uniref:sugar transferase n=1 Tax=Pleomorphovibrio marinus TaxID=2164132 RepID=UPI000E0AC361|nr:sugar transferase [Pleomorphovibrio marinus]